MEESGLLKNVYDMGMSHLIHDLKAAILGLTSDEAEFNIFDNIFSEELDNLNNKLVSSPSLLQV
jgi:hypothetical protein